VTGGGKRLSQGSLLHRFGIIIACYIVHRRTQKNFLISQGFFFHLSPRDSGVARTSYRTRAVVHPLCLRLDYQSTEPRPGELNALAQYTYLPYLGQKGLAIPDGITAHHSGPINLKRRRTGRRQQTLELCNCNSKTIRVVRPSRLKCFLTLYKLSLAS
jgi:hypothetical protein